MTKKEKLKALQGAFAGAEYIPESAIPDCKVGISGSDKYHRKSKSGHENRASIAAIYRSDRDRLANQHSEEANREWAERMRRRQEEIMAERLARWQARMATERVAEAARRIDEQEAARRRIDDACLGFAIAFGRR